MDMDFPPEILKQLTEIDPTIDIRYVKSVQREFDRETKQWRIVSWEVFD